MWGYLVSVKNDWNVFLKPVGKEQRRREIPNRPCCKQYIRSPYDYVKAIRSTLANLFCRLVRHNHCRGCCYLTPRPTFTAFTTKLNTCLVPVWLYCCCSRFERIRPWLSLTQHVKLSSSNERSGWVQQKYELKQMKAITQMSGTCS